MLAVDSILTLRAELFEQAEQILHSQGEWLGVPWRLDRPWGWDERIDGNGHGL